MLPINVLVLWSKMYFPSLFSYSCFQGKIMVPCKLLSLTYTLLWRTLSSWEKKINFLNLTLVWANMFWSLTNMLVMKKELPCWIRSRHNWQRAVQSFSQNSKFVLGWLVCWGFFAFTLSIVHEQKVVCKLKILIVYAVRLLFGVLPSSFLGCWSQVLYVDIDFIYDGKN